MQCIWLQCLIGLGAIMMALSQNAEPNLQGKTSNLIFVFKITRHGARTPAAIYPGDPNNNYWTDELGELTNEGKKEHYHIGKEFRSQYTNLLSEIYKPEEINAQSTDMDRTIMSAQCFLASLYRPTGSQVWKKDLDWQPIPVRILDYDVNAITANASASLLANCPAGLQNDQFYKKHSKTIQAIQTASGVPYSSCLDMNFFGLLDTLTVENFYDLPAPYGLGHIFNDVINLKNAFFVALFSAPGMKYALNAPTFNDIVASLESKSNNTNPAKAYTYFMHDANVLSFLAELTDSHLTSPAFAASVTVELYANKGSKDYDVKIYHIPTSTSTRELQYITGCGYTCPLPKFLGILRRSISTPISTSGCPCKSYH